MDESSFGGTNENLIPIFRASPKQSAALLASPAIYSLTVSTPTFDQSARPQAWTCSSIGGSPSAFGCGTEPCLIPSSEGESYSTANPLRVHKKGLPPRNGKHPSALPANLRHSHCVVLIALCDVEGLSPLRQLTVADARNLCASTALSALLVFLFSRKTGQSR